jgi:peptidoglycan/LPS O-acetylase OafA/YrhL
MKENSINKILSFFILPKRHDLALISRGIASLLVVFWHVSLYNNENTTAHYFILPGRSAVWIFFALSGYLLSSGFIYLKYDFSREKLKRFYANRFLRVYPLFFLISIIGLFLTFYVKHESLALDVPFILKNFLTLQYNHAYPLNGVFWTLGIEIQFYLFFPLIIYFQLNKNKFIPVIFYVLWYIVLGQLKHFDSSLLNDSRSLIGNLMHFQIGIIAAFYRNEILKLASKFSYFNAFTAIVAILCFVISNKIYHTNNNLYLASEGNILVDIGSLMILCLHICLENNISTMPNLIWKIGSLLGALSYGLYVWHPIVFICSSETLASSFIYVTIASLIMATVTYFLLEKPLLKLKF